MTSTAILSELSKADPNTMIEMFVIDLSPIADYYSIPANQQYYYLYNGTNARTDGGDTNLVWQGVTYTRTPIVMEKYIATSSGELPTPTLQISDLGGSKTFYNITTVYSDIIGARVLRKRTFLKFIDAANFNGGTSPYSPDPFSYLPDEIFSVNRKSSQSNGQITFELATPDDMEGLMLPKRLVLPNLCPWKYRGGQGNTTIKYSTNSGSANRNSSWTKAAYVNSGKINAVAANGAQVIAVGNGGTILESTDNGVTWTALTSLSDHNLYGVTYSNSTWILVGANGKIYTGTKAGSVWTWVTRTSGTTKDLYAVAGNGATIATGGWGVHTYSTDTGATWNTPVNSYVVIRTIVYNADANFARFIAAGDYSFIAQSTNGATWTAVSTIDIGSLAYVQLHGASLVKTSTNNMILVCRDGQVLHSSTYNTWTYKAWLWCINKWVVHMGSGLVTVGMMESPIVWKNLDPTNDSISVDGSKWVPIRVGTTLGGVCATLSGSTLINLGGEQVTDLDAASGCTYEGTAYFDINDNSVVSPANDVCGKRLSSCQIRHNTSKDTRGALPFGGFPTAGAIG